MARALPKVSGYSPVEPIVSRQELNVSRQHRNLHFAIFDFRRKSLYTFDALNFLGTKSLLASEIISYRLVVRFNRAAGKRRDVSQPIELSESGFSLRGKCAPEKMGSVSPCRVFKAICRAITQKRDAICSIAVGRYVSVKSSFAPNNQGLFEMKRFLQILQGRHDCEECTVDNQTIVSQLDAHQFIVPSVAFFVRASHFSDGNVSRYYRENAREKALVVVHNARNIARCPAIFADRAHLSEVHGKSDCDANRNAPKKRPQIFSHVRAPSDFGQIATCRQIAQQGIAATGANGLRG